MWGEWCHRSPMGSQLTNKARGLQNRSLALGYVVCAASNCITTRHESRINSLRRYAQGMEINPWTLVKWNSSRPSSNGDNPFWFSAFWPLHSFAMIHHLLLGTRPLLLLLGGGSSRWLQLRSLKAYGSISALYSTTQKSTTLVISACGSKVGHVVTTSLARHASIGAWMFVLCVQPHRNATQ